MPADIEFGSQKVIDVKPSSRKKTKQIMLLLKMLVVLLWFILAMVVADKYYYHYWQKPAPAVAAKPPTQTPIVAAPVAPIMNTPALTPAPVAAPLPADDVKGIQKRLDNLEAANKNLLIYFAARDLKDSLDDPDNFKDQLDFLQQALGNDLNIAGKIDILKQATNDGLVTRAKLLADLKTLQKNMDHDADQNLTGSISNALGNLIKITKTEGELSAADYNSIIRRSELVLSRAKISSQEVQQVVDDAKKLGHPADGFVKEAENLQRVLEVTDYLVIYTKSKLLNNNG